jgi:hypothetical protein
VVFGAGYDEGNVEEAKIDFSSTEQSYFLDDEKVCELLDNEKAVCLPQLHVASIFSKRHGREWPSSLIYSHHYLRVVLV